MGDVTARDRAHAAYSLFLRAMADANAGDIAQAMGVSDSKVSDLKNTRMQECLLLLAHLGLKVVPASMQCMSPETHQFLVASHLRVVKTAPQLLFGSEEA